MDKDNFIYRFIENPYNVFNGLNVNYVPTLYQVRTVGVNNRNNVDTTHISSGEDVWNALDFHKSGKINWELVPFNFRQKKRIDELKKAIAKIFDYDTELIENKIKEIIGNYPKDKNKIIEAYGKVSGSFNTNSMTLFSGTKNSYIEQYYAIPKYCFCDRCCFTVKENGCLYLGDYDASGTEKWVL